MADKNDKASSKKSKRRPPSLSISSREDELISLAVNLAEKQLREGTATSQVISHYLKLASSKERLEREMLLKQNELIQAKIDSLRANQNTEKLYADAIEAMKAYGGNDEKE